MKRLLAPLTLVSVLSTSAVAADMAVKVAPRVAPIETYSWSGFYIGGQAGGAWMDASELFTNNTPVTDPLRFNASSFIGGGHVGLQGQWGSWVLGAEGTFNWTDLGQTVPSPVAGGPKTRTFKIEGVASAVAKVGYTGGPWMIYVKGGWADLPINHSSLNPVNNEISNNRFWSSGWTVGGGFDYQFSKNWIAGIDANYYTTHYDTPTNFYINGGFVGLGGITNSRLDVYAVTGRLSYLFNWGGPVVAKY